MRLKFAAVGLGGERNNRHRHENPTLLKEPKRVRDLAEFALVRGEGSNQTLVARTLQGADVVRLEAKVFGLLHGLAR